MKVWELSDHNPQLHVFQKIHTLLKKKKNDKNSTIVQVASNFT